MYILIYKIHKYLLELKVKSTNGIISENINFEKFVNKIQLNNGITYKFVKERERKTKKVYKN